MRRFLITTIPDQAKQKTALEAGFCLSQLLHFNLAYQHL